jgi:aspartate 1-decarboxylase
MSYGIMDESESKTNLPRVVHVDAANRVIGLAVDPAQPVPGVAGLLRGDTIRR